MIILRSVRSAKKDRHSQGVRGHASDSLEKKITSRGKTQKGIEHSHSLHALLAFSPTIRNHSLHNMAKGEEIRYRQKKRENDRIQESRASAGGPRDATS